LQILDSPGAGRGVFAGREFSIGEVIEVAPVLVVPAAQLDALRATGLRHYVWHWGSSVAVGLGIISLVNHGRPPNARWSANHAAGELTLTAIAHVDPGTEILVDYSNGGERPLSFEPRPTAP
jgi:hypothetical protein